MLPILTPSPASGKIDTGSGAASHSNAGTEASADKSAFELGSKNQFHFLEACASTALRFWCEEESARGFWRW